MDALTAVGIAHLADRRADQLSGGQQQRVAIARTLAQDPTVVLADEPIASLDPVSAEGVMDSLQRINRERGIPVVVNLHQVDVARRYATRIIGMSAGRIVFDGPPDQLTPEVVDRIYRGGARKAAAPTEDPAPDAGSGRVVTTIDHPPSAPGAGHKEQAWIPSPAS
jgi:phosphonate transport system ATP-binding protein